MTAEADSSVHGREADSGRAALAMQLEHVETLRPFTSTFAADVLQAAGTRLREARIERQTDDTFYAVAAVEGPAGVREGDARPSDTLNLALAMGAPVFAPAVPARRCRACMLRMWRRSSKK